jgi:hypothetical protein
MRRQLSLQAASGLHHHDRRLFCLQQLTQLPVTGCVIAKLQAPPLAAGHIQMILRDVHTHLYLVHLRNPALQTYGIKCPNQLFGFQEETCATIKL